MDKQITINKYNWTLLSNEKEQILFLPNSEDES